jgi:hypothetical protein
VAIARVQSNGVAALATTLPTVGVFFFSLASFGDHAHLFYWAEDSLTIRWVAQRAVSPIQTGRLRRDHEHRGDRDRRRTLRDPPFSG